MTQYAISTLPGRVLGFLESDTMPVLHDPVRIAHVMVDLVQGWPEAPTPTSELWIANGVLYWVETAPLAQRRANKIEAMRHACEAHIFAGFMCSALGEPMLYPANDRDQKNLVASVTDSLLAGGDPDWRTPFWCADAAGVWEFRPHTIAQIQQVGREGKAAILAALGRNETLSRQIAVASAEQLPGIAW